jgi:hypothetical protein
MKHFLLSFLLVFIFNISNGQIPFGNEWIKENQKYLKIKVAENGIYRISHSQLADKSFIPSNLNPKNFQLFHNGVEVPIYVEGEANNLFESDEYVEFYGRKNDGKLDETLYNPIGLQPNPDVSLYDNHSYYYLTVSETPGKRYTNTSISVNGLNPEPYIIYTASANYAEAYYPGSYLIDVMSLSEYIEGEGYLGALNSLGATQTKTLNTPNSVSSSFVPTLSYYVAGRSNAASTDAGGNNHHLQISISGNQLVDTKFRGYNTLRGTVNLTNNMLAENTAVNFSSINDIGAATDFQAVGYARITYARNTDASNLNALSFRVSNSNPLLLLNFNNNNWAEATLLDETNQKRYVGVKAGSTTSFIIENSGNNQVHLAANGGYKVPVAVENVTFNLVKSSAYSAKLLIVTHKNLLTSANEYAAYKVSKGFSTSVITTEDIYDQFYYGQHHPLAIKNLARYLLLSSNTVQKPEYLLLLGKGYETPKFNLEADLVPTMGFPASDSYLTSEIVDNSMAPALATGRVPAKTNEEVLVYLNKVKKYDLQGNSLWRKNIINITGGSGSAEDEQFSSYLRNLTAIAAKEHFGARPINYYKSVTDPITDNLMTKISNNINDGVGLLNFLGHGSTTSTAVSIGNPAYLNNGDKLLTYIINGCSTGNAFVNGSLGEDYIFQNDKGAITWIGTSSEGIASYLYHFTNLLFQNSFETNYSSSIAKNMARSARAYQSSNDNFNKAHLRQYILLGDPTVSFYSPALPDYELKNEDIGLEDKTLNASSPTVKLFAIVKNIGKAVSDNIPIRVSRTLPNNSIFNYPIANYTKVLNTDTIIIELDNTLPNIKGNNRFLVTIDPNNQITELLESNNSAEFNYLIQSNGINLISPTEFAIVNTSNVKLQLQASDLFVKNQSYNFEIDTLKTFDSPWKKSSPNINGNALVSWLPNTSLQDGKVYYWRAKKSETTADNWETSSFTYIANSSDGWNQSHYQQFTNIETQLINLNPSTKQFEFTTTAYPVLIATKGNNGPTNADRRFRVSVSVGALSFSSAEFEGLAIAAFNQNIANKLFEYDSPYIQKSGGLMGQYGTGEFRFNTSVQQDLDALKSYLENIPSGYYVTGFNGRNFNPKSLPQEIIVLLENLGLAKFSTINNGEPYAFWTQKSASKKINTLELTADYASGIDPTTQTINFSYDLLYPWGSGNITSEKIGPAASWAEAKFDVTTQATDEVKFNIIGVNAAGNDIVLKSNISATTIDLSDISADDYPFIKVSSSIVDNTDKTIPIFNGWKVLFNGYPDVSFSTEIKDDFYAKSLQRGDSLKLAIGITNLEKYSTDSVYVKYKITKEDRNVISGVIDTIKPLSLDENHIVNFKYPTSQIPGNNNIQLYLEPKNMKDKHEFNNYAVYDLEVINDVKEPIVEVYFDNRRIINGDIVSPTPKISVNVRDENKFFILSDTTNIELYLKNEEEQNFKRIAFSDNKIQVNQVGTSTNNRIDFLYTPETLADGRYTLKLRGKDVSGNFNTTNDFLIDFEVVNEQAITNFLPYPNPFTTRMKFVYQITGKIPDKIKIQIMTVTGKIVKEVFKEELGNISIGNNISEFTWDGTDQFGDRLANGVYFYNVITENNDKSEIKHRANNTDVYFRKNFGKIYLMR